MLLIQFDPKSKVPKYKQIVNQIGKMIDEEVLKEGQKLPATRALADLLDVHRTTVYRAYEELWALGYIHSKPGSYSTVRKRVKPISKKSEQRNELVNWSDLKSDRCLNLHEITFPDLKLEGTIDFRRLAPDKDCMPYQLYRKCLSEAINQNKAQLLDYGNPFGYQSLRERICELMNIHNVSVNANEILVTNGAQNALDLIFTYLLNPGDKIVVEDPTYSALLPLLKLYQVQIFPVSLTDSGMNLEELKAILENNEIKLIYTMPNFQNPTGISSDQSHREQLLNLSEQFNVPIVEDGFEEEMKYFGKCVLPIKSMDAKGIVIYVGTFSKVLFPGIRIGWIAGSEQLIYEISKIKQSKELSGNQLDQAAIDLFCRKGYFELHTAKMHRIYRKRMQSALKAVGKYIPEHVSHTKPNGGYTIWFSFQTQLAEAEVMQRISERNVQVSPGSMFSIKSTSKVCFRLSISHTNENEINKGVQIIGNILKEIRDEEST